MPGRSLMTMGRRGLAGALLGAGLVLQGCVSPPLGPEPTQGPTTPTRELLRALPAPKQKVVVAVYGFPDQTGQYRPSETVTTYSRAVTQGGGSVLIRSLQDAGQGRWFTVVEREGLQQLVTERQIIRETRTLFRSPDGQQLPPPPPLLYAGMILQGGIIGYDSNTVTGGLGARYFGIGGSSEYRQDTVTVMLRAVSTQSGEIISSVTADKTILSVMVGANVFRFIDAQKLLSIDAGFTVNEPGLVALQQAVELSVYTLIMEGALSGVWQFADPAAGQMAVKQYLAEYRGKAPTPTTPVAANQDGGGQPGAAGGIAAGWTVPNSTTGGS